MSDRITHQGEYSVWVFFSNMYFFSEPIPQFLGLQVDLGKLPLPQRIILPSFEPLLLLLLGHRKIEFQQYGFAGILEEILLIRDDLLQESPVLVLGAKSHHRLHQGPVVPASVEPNDLPR